MTPFTGRKIKGQGQGPGAQGQHFGIFARVATWRIKMKVIN